MLTTFTWSGTETQATGEVLHVNVHGNVKMDSNASTWSGTETRATGEVLDVNVHRNVQMDSNACTWSGMEMQAIGEVGLYDLLLPCITFQYHSYSIDSLLDPIFVAGKEEKLL